MDTLDEKFSSLALDFIREVNSCQAHDMGSSRQTSVSHSVADVIFVPKDRGKFARDNALQNQITLK